MSIDMARGASWLEGVDPDDMRRVVEALHRAHELNAQLPVLDTLLGRLLDESKALARAEACSLMLYDNASEELYFVIAFGETGDTEALKRDVRMKLGQGIAGQAALHRESINVADAAQDDRVFRGADEITQFETRSILAVPLVEDEVLIGVLEVLNKEDGGPFTDLDQRVMEIFSSLAASAITRARLIEENLQAERLAAVGQAVAGLSHYTKNILNGMIAGVELIDEALHKRNTYLVMRAWPPFKRSVERMQQVVEDMLAYSTGREPLYEDTDLAALIDECIQDFRGLLHHGGPEIVIDTASLDGPVEVDPRGLYRCLLNLISNAGDAVGTDGGRITIRAGKTPADELEIAVSDNGAGIDREHAAQLFDVFFSTKGSGGTGLGLAVTKKIVEEHGGAISAENGPEGGAVFTILIPARNQRKD